VQLDMGRDRRIPPFRRTRRGPATPPYDIGCFGDATRATRLNRTSVSAKSCSLHGKTRFASDGKKLSDLVAGVGDPGPASPRPATTEAPFPRNHESAGKRSRPSSECRVAPCGRTVCARQAARRQATALHSTAWTRLSGHPLSSRRPPRIGRSHEPAPAGYLIFAASVSRRDTSSSI
jgi:hypothetical protein